MSAMSRNPRAARAKSESRHVHLVIDIDRELLLDRRWRAARRTAAAVRGCAPSMIRPDHPWETRFNAPRWVGEILETIAVVRSCVMDAADLTAVYATALAWEHTATGSASRICELADQHNPEAVDDAATHIGALRLLGEELNYALRPLDQRVLADMAHGLATDSRLRLAHRTLVTSGWTQSAMSATQHALELRTDAIAAGVWDLIPAIIEQTPAQPDEWLMIARSIRG